MWSILHNNVFKLLSIGDCIHIVLGYLVWHDFIGTGLNKMKSALEDNYKTVWRDSNTAKTKWPPYSAG